MKNENRVGLTSELKDRFVSRSIRVFTSSRVIRQKIQSPFSDLCEVASA
jgi:flagellar biosynthesis regulator FlaF